MRLHYLHVLCFSVNRKYSAITRLRVPISLNPSYKINLNFCHVLEDIAYLKAYSAD